MFKIMIFIHAFLISLLIHTATKGQLVLPGIFTDNMMFQQGMPIHIWGKDCPAQSITVELGVNTSKTIVQSDSTWEVYLPAQQATINPAKLTIKNKSQAFFIKNILIGDIWLCIGQSNMEFPVFKEQHYHTEKLEKPQAGLRFFNPTYVGKNVYGIPYTDSMASHLTPQHFYAGQWSVCDSNSMASMSAVGYYFGKNIVTHTGIPIGLINLSIGGAPIETFVDKNALLASPKFKEKGQGDWLINNSLPVWVRERGLQNIGNKTQVLSDENGKYHSYKPGFAYDAGIKPIIPFPIKGIICYQGESNAQELERVLEYNDLTTLMVTDFRKKWNQPSLPFYYTQLSSIDTLHYKSQYWPFFRDEQRKLMSTLKHCGMAISSDLGALHDVHPTNKKDIGERLSLWALSKTYHQRIIYCGPSPKKAIYKKNRVIITFTHSLKRLQKSTGTLLKSFSLNGIDDCNATIRGRKVIIHATGKPPFIYYGWKPFSNGNLVNSAGLPASTFRIMVE